MDGIAKFILVFFSAKNFMNKHLLAEKSLFLPRAPVHKVRLKEKKNKLWVIKVKQSKQKFCYS